MSEKEFKAKERTVQKMSRDGLLEENLRSGTSKRVSQRVRQDSTMCEGDISSDAGAFRHSKDMPADSRMLYAEQEADVETRGDASGKTRRMQNRRKTQERDLSDRSRVQEEDSPEGGDFDTERSSKETGDRKVLQRKRAGKIREETENEGAGKHRLPQKVASEEDSGDEGAEENESLTSEYSSRMDSVRGHSSALSETSAKTAADYRHDRNKKQVQKYVADQKRKERLSETSKTDTVELSDAKEEIASKQKRERLNQEQRKQKRTTDTGKKKPGRLSFDDEDAEGTMVRGSGAGMGRKIAAAAAGTAALAAHAKVYEAQDENAGVEAAHTGERLTEESVRKAASVNLRQSKSKSGASRRKSETAGLHKLNFGEEPVKAVNAAKQEAEKKATIRKFFQKQRYRRMYAAAKKEEKTAQQVFKTSQNLVTKAAVVVKEAFRRNSKVLLGLGILVFFSC